MSDFLPQTSFKDGAAEVREKLRTDISKLARFRRGVSLRPSMGCIDCDATGKLPCITCEGSGQAKVILKDETEPCATCEGKGYVTCTSCAGRGWVLNKNRKKLLWVLGIGGLAWLFVFFRLWGGDVFPEQMARMREGGGKAARAPVPPGAVARPGGSTGSAGTVITPTGSPLRPNQQAPITPPSPRPILPRDGGVRR